VSKRDRSTVQGSADESELDKIKEEDRCLLNSFPWVITRGDECIENRNGCTVSAPKSNLGTKFQNKSSEFPG